MNANNDWTTVRSGAWNPPKTNSAFGSHGMGRQMPAAFSGRQQAADNPAAARRDQYNRMNAEAEAALSAKAAREKREAAEKALAAERDALALTSETSYPSLGGGAAKPAIKPTTMNFGRVVAERAALDKLEAEEREMAAAAAAAASSSFDWAPTGLSLGAAKRRSLIGTRCFDDGPEDYDGPEEDFGDNDVGNDSDMEDDVVDAPPTEETGEYNADLAKTRRRGDKNSLY